MFYDSPDGTTYTAPYIDPGTEQASSATGTKIASGSSTVRPLFPPTAARTGAAISPARFIPSAMMRPALTDNFIMSTRAADSSTCPDRTRVSGFHVGEHRRSYAPFERMQDYFVLLRNEDGVWRIRQ